MSNNKMCLHVQVTLNTHAIGMCSPTDGSHGPAMQTALWGPTRAPPIMGEVGDQKIWMWPTCVQSFKSIIRHHFCTISIQWFSAIQIGEKEPSRWHSGIVVCEMLDRHMSPQVGPTHLPVYVWICVYGYIYIEREKERGREKMRQHRLTLAMQRWTWAFQESSLEYE